MFLEQTNHINKILDFKPFPSIHDKESWDSLNKERKAEILDLADSYLPYHYPAIPATLYMDYFRSGRRVLFEDAYMERRRKLNTFVIAECIDQKGRYIDAIVDGIMFICEESGWQLPPHNTYTRSFGENCLPDYKRPVLDLFACETAALLAMIYYLLKDKLDTISEHICGRIEYELTHRILTPYLSSDFWWMGRNGESTNNWTIWCTQNVLLTTFLLTSNYDKSKVITVANKQISIENLENEILYHAAYSIDRFIEAYGEDGCCDEGPTYYRHAGLCLFNAMEVLNHIGNKQYSSLYQESKIRNIAKYIYNVHVDDMYYINFADSSPVAGRAGAREYLFAKRIKDEDMMAFAALDYRACEDKILSQELNLFYRIQSLFADKEMLEYKNSSKGCKELYYESVGLFLTKDSTNYLAVKAGGNGDNHNHNDTGSLTIYKNGKPFLIDVGVETYSEKTFSDKRYEIWTMQSAYHNLPTINGYMQKDGSNYKASNVSVSFLEDHNSISMDISKAYPKEANISSYVRQVTLYKNKYIEIYDQFDSSTSVEEGSCILSLMSYELPIIKENIISIGSLGTIKVEGANKIHMEEIPITDKRLQTAWKHNIYRIQIENASNYFRLII